MKSGENPAKNVYHDLLIIVKNKNLSAKSTGLHNERKSRWPAAGRESVEFVSPKYLRKYTISMIEFYIFFVFVLLTERERTLRK